MEDRRAAMETRLLKLEHKETLRQLESCQRSLAEVMAQQTSAEASRSRALMACLLVDGARLLRCVLTYGSEGFAAYSVCRSWRSSLRVAAIVAAASASRENAKRWAAWKRLGGIVDVAPVTAGLKALTLEKCYAKQEEEGRTHRTGYRTAEEIAGRRASRGRASVRPPLGAIDEQATGVSAKDTLDDSGDSEEDEEAEEAAAKGATDGSPDGSLASAGELAARGLFARVGDRPTPKGEDCPWVSRADDDAIELDLHRTCTSLTKESRLRPLRRVLRSLCVLHGDVGYCQGMNFVAAFVLRRSGKDGAGAFLLASRVYEALDLRAVYAREMPRLKLLLFQLERLLRRHLPRIQDALDGLGATPELYATGWSPRHTRVLQSYFKCSDRMCEKEHPPFERP